MTSVIDASYRIGDHAPALAAAGVRTVFRYYTRDSDPAVAKRLHPAEAAQLVAAGLRIGAVYEGKRGDQVDNFDREMGLKDGTFARTYAAHAIGQPAGSTIYFGIDVDMSDDDVTLRAIPYLQAVRETMTEANGEPLYDIGVYSGGAVCQAALDHGLVTQTWVSMSTGYNGSKAFRASGRWTLDQKPGQVIGGVKCDPDLVNGAANVGDFVPHLPTPTT
jgi:hypothetical protein